MSTTSMLAPSTSSSTCGQSRKVARTSAWNWRYARPLLACGRREYSTSTYSDAEYRFEAEAAVACQAAQAATLDENGWQLENGVERHAEALDTFEIPDEAVRSRLVPTSDAKLIVSLQGADGPQIERMWVRVTGYTDTGYVGELNNEPRPALRSGSVKSSSSVPS